MPFQNRREEPPENHSPFPERTRPNYSPVAEANWPSLLFLIGMGLFPHQFASFVGLLRERERERERPLPALFIVTVDS